MLRNLNSFHVRGRTKAAGCVLSDGLAEVTRVLYFSRNTCLLLFVLADLLVVEGQLFYFVTVLDTWV